MSVTSPPVEEHPGTTTVLGGVPSTVDEPRRRLERFSSDDLFELLGSAISALALMWVIFDRLVAFEGVFGFVVCVYLMFLCIYAVVSGQHHGRLAASDRVMTVVMWSAGALVVGLLVMVIGYVIVRGLPGLRPNFFTETLATTGSLDPATAGGGLHSIVGTFQQVGIALLISLPVAMVTAVYLNEVGGRFAKPVRFVIDAMSGIPSIVAGLFIYAIWIVPSGRGYSGFAAALALSIIMLPTICRTALEMLRLVPDGLREAALALGAPRWSVTWKIVLPTARSGLVTAVILGVARAVGETAPVLLTSFGSSVMNGNPFAGPQDNLPLFVWKQIGSFKDAQQERAWIGAFVLIVLVLTAFTAARWLGNKNRKTR